MLVRRNAVIETLGAATLLCVDKTGTLTENGMRVARVWTDAGDVAVERTAPGDGVRITIAIDPQTGVLSGFTGGNEFTAPMTLFERSISIGAVQEDAGESPTPAAATDEERFLRALPSVQRHARAGKSLELLGPASGEDALLRLRFADEQ